VWSQLITRYRGLRNRPGSRRRHWPAGGGEQRPGLAFFMIAFWIDAVGGVFVLVDAGLKEPVFDAMTLIFVTGAGYLTRQWITERPAPVAEADAPGTAAEQCAYALVTASGH
jgi:hypothetical protein